jgi:hypothetical protein
MESIKLVPSRTHDFSQVVRVQRVQVAPESSTSQLRMIDGIVIVVLINGLLDRSVSTSLYCLEDYRLWMCTRVRL